MFVLHSYFGALGFDVIIVNSLDQVLFLYGNVLI